MLGLIPIPWKIAGAAVGLLLIAAAFLGVYVKGRSDGAAAIEAADAIAIQQAQKKADALANELIIAQAAAMAVNEKTVTIYRDKVANDPSANSVSPAVRDALRGVHALRSR